jgi:hypothetical protein
MLRLPYGYEWSDEDAACCVSTLTVGLVSCSLVDAFVANRTASNVLKNASNELRN